MTAAQSALEDADPPVSLVLASPGEAGETLWKRRLHLC